MLDPSGSRAGNVQSNTAARFTAVRNHTGILGAILAPRLVPPGPELRWLPLFLRSPPPLVEENRGGPRPVAAEHISAPAGNSSAHLISDISQQACGERPRRMGGAKRNPSH